MRSSAPRSRRRDGDVLARLPRHSRGARPRDGDMARGARRRGCRARGLHAPADAAVSRPVPRADRQRASVAAAEFPGARAIERGARGGGRDDRRDGASRRRGRRHRPGAAPGAGAGRAARVARPSGSTRSSTDCCPRWCESCARADLRYDKGGAGRVRARAGRARLRAGRERRHRGVSRGPGAAR